MADLKVGQYEQALSVSTARVRHPVVCQYPLPNDVRRSDVREQGDDHRAIQPQVQRRDIIPLLRSRFDLDCRQLGGAPQYLPDDLQQAVAHDQSRE